MSKNVCYFESHAMADILDLILAHVPFTRNVCIVQGTCVALRKAVARIQEHVCSSASHIIEWLDIQRSVPGIYGDYWIETMGQLDAIISVMWTIGHKLSVKDIRSFCFLVLFVSDTTGFIRNDPDGEWYLWVHGELLLRIYETQYTYTETLCIDPRTLRNCNDVEKVRIALAYIYDVELDEIEAYQLSNAFCIYGTERKYYLSEYYYIKQNKIDLFYHLFPDMQRGCCNCTIS